MPVFCFDYLFRTQSLKVVRSLGDGDEVPDRRPAVKELSRLGWVYGPLNQLAPLVRLAAITTYVRQSSSHPHLFPVVASIAASLALRPLNLLARRLVPDRILGTEDMPLSPGDDKGGSVSTATLRTRLLAAHLMQLVAHVTLLGVGGVDLVACGLDLGKPHAGEAGLVGAATAASRNMSCSASSSVLICEGKNTYARNKDGTRTSKAQNISDFMKWRLSLTPAGLAG